MNTQPGTAPFATRLIAWQRRAGRHDLPWQHPRTPYRVWLSEIMLQQTQVATVIPYFQRFVAAFPEVGALAAAPAESVMALWSGLGYYARARNLHAAARQVVAEHGGMFPASSAELAQLPGVGRSTAAAIAAFCFGERCAILDGNVRRVLARHAGIDGDVRAPAVERQLWQLAEARLPAQEIDTYTQGLMDLGATCCRRHKPDCAACPVSADCVALREHRVHELPVPRARKARPERATTLLIIEHAGHIWLEPRPAHGIWGGLLSLPELPRLPDPVGTHDLGALPDAVSAAVLARFGRPAHAPEALTPRHHAFTHFRLHIRAWHIRLAQAHPHSAEPAAEGRWVSADDIAGAALPAPIRPLLAEALSRSRSDQEAGSGSR